MLITRKQHHTFSSRVNRKNKRIKQEQFNSELGVLQELTFITGVFSVVRDFLFLFEFIESKITDFHNPSAVHQTVGGLEVAMGDHTRTMNIDHTLEEYKDRYIFNSLQPKTVKWRNKKRVK